MPVQAPSSAVIVWQSAVESWTKQLIDLGGRNRLVYYRDLKVGTMDLTDALHDNAVAFERLLSGQPVALSRLFEAGRRVG